MNWWHTLSINQKKQLAARTRTAMRAGQNQNQATASAAQTMGIQTSTPVAPTPTPPTPPPAPKVPLAPVQVKATQASMGQGVRRPKKSSVKTRLSDLRIKRPQVNQALAIGAGGTGLNVGGY